LVIFGKHRRQFFNENVKNMCSFRFICRFFYWKLGFHSTDFRAFVFISQKMCWKFCWNLQHRRRSDSSDYDESDIQIHKVSL